MINILIAEDEIKTQAYLNKHLKRYFNVAACVESGEEAVREALSQNVDIILMDITLSGKMDGIKAAEEILSQKEIPVLFITAQNDNHTLERAKMAQPFGYILKPIDLSILKTNIEISLQMYRQLKSFSCAKSIYKNNPAKNQMVKTINQNMSQHKEEKIVVNWAGEKRIEIVNNRFMKQYWIIEE